MRIPARDISLDTAALIRMIFKTNNILIIDYHSRRMICSGKPCGDQCQQGFCLKTFLSGREWV